MLFSALPPKPPMIVPKTYISTVGAVMMIVEMTAYYRKKGMTLSDALVELYKSYGYYAERMIDIYMEGLDGIENRIAAAMFGVPAIKGIEFGEGFNSARMTGSVWNDKMRVSEDGKITFETNHAGGILGGISNGNQIVFRLAVKPVPSIFIAQKTVNKAGENIDLEIKGRHDVCLAPRIVPVVEAMAAITILDLLLQQKIFQLRRMRKFVSSHKRHLTTINLKI